MINKKSFRIFLILLSVAGAIVVYLATSNYGPGLSTDGARYLSTAESIAARRGIIDYLGLPLVNWPPLYPLLLAGLNRLTGLDVFVIGQLINIIAFGVIIWLSGIFFERSLPGNYTFATVASLIVATSLPFIEVSANIASDPLYMVCVLLFLLAAQDYARSFSSRNWWAMVAITIAACFLRYAGLTLIISGTLIVLFTQGQPLRGRSPKQSSTKFLGIATPALRARNGQLWEAAKFGLVSGLPIALWAAFFNYRLTGSILGAHLPANPWGNFVAAIEKWAGWFLPERVLQVVPPLAIAALLLLVLATHSNRARWSAWLKRMQSAELLPSAIFYLVYGATLIFAISYPEHHVAGSQRLHVVLQPLFLILATVTALELIPTMKEKETRRLILFVFALWLLFPFYRVQSYVRASIENGDVSYYNLYNTRTLRESDIVAEIQAMELDEGERVYSNNEAAAWFYLRRRIYRLPRYDAELGQDLETVILEFDGWPSADELATLIWFERELDYKELVPTPDMLADFIRLTPVFVGRYGNVYLMDVD
ncbi:MAG: hypothetical protein WEC37_02370 [Anaerolineales bacterium]